MDILLFFNIFYYSLKLCISFIQISLSILLILFECLSKFFEYTDIIKFYLFSRLNNAQFGTQCLLLSVVEKVDWLRLQFNYHPKECFRAPVGRIKKFINSECKKYRHHLEREAVKKEMKNALPFASNEDIVHKIVTGAIPFPDKLKGRRVGFFSTSSDSYSYTGGSHKNLGWPAELNKNGAEEFVVKYWSGAEVRIPNNRAAIKALFNATLNKLFFDIVDLCKGGGKSMWSSYVYLFDPP